MENQADLAGVPFGRGMGGILATAFGFMWLGWGSSALPDLLVAVEFRYPLRQILVVELEHNLKRIPVSPQNIGTRITTVHGFLSAALKAHRPQGSDQDVLGVQK